MLLNDDKKKDVVPRTAWNRTRRNEMSLADNLVKEWSNVCGLKIAKNLPFPYSSGKLILPMVIEPFLKEAISSVGPLNEFQYYIAIFCKLNLSRGKYQILRIYQ